MTAEYLLRDGAGRYVGRYVFSDDRLLSCDFETDRQKASRFRLFVPSVLVRAIEKKYKVKLTGERCTMVIDIDYDEGDPLTYRGVRVGDYRFATGDPASDFRAALVFCRKFEIPGIFSSSIDHFVTDSDGLYEWVIEKGFGEVFIKAEDSDPKLHVGG